MRIKIAVKLRPFSHRPGIRCLIPFSTWEAQVFPAKVFFYNRAGLQEEELSLPIEGPVEGFTVLQDMERGRIEVFGKGKQGFFRYFLTAGSLSFIKGNSFDLSFIDKKELIILPKRLSLGNHKKQDWDMIQRRCDLAEIFPFWIQMSQLIPKIPLPEEPIGTDLLLAQGKLLEVFQAGFQGILCPRLKDENYLGLLADTDIPAGDSPLGILHEGARQIEELLFREETNRWFFLPHLPKEFHAGRFISLQTKEGDILDFEWSKKQLKKLIIHPKTSRTIQLSLQSKLKSFRVRKNLRHRGERLDREDPLHLQEGQILYIDRFMH